MEPHGVPTALARLDRPPSCKVTTLEPSQTRPWRRGGMALVLLFLSLEPAHAGDSFQWNPGTGFRSAAFQPAHGTDRGFSLVSSAQSGIQFSNRLSPVFALNNQILENGAGLALGDIDGDGWTDLYLCGSENSNALYRNLGNWKFTDITASASVACSGQFSTGCLLADVDGDGDLDLLVNGLGTGTRLFLNNGSGKFTEELKSGLSRTSAATSLAMADVDGDGDLDLYVTCYRTSSARNEPDAPKVSARVVRGQVEVTPADRFLGILRGDGQVEIVEKGEPDTLYLNQGAGRFQAVPWTTGRFLDEQGKALTVPPEDWGLSVLLRDLNGDGQIDIYVCNDFFRSRDRFWIGDGTGRFRAADPLAWRAMPLSSMAVDAGDLNRDGVDDFLAVEMLSRRHSIRQQQRANALKVEHGLPFSDPRYTPEVLANTLHLGRGDGTFTEVAWLSGLAATDWSWNLAIVDVDLDGWDDVLIATGNGHDVLNIDAQNQLDRAGAASGRPSLDYYPPLAQRSLIFRNQGGLQFEEVGERWGWNEIGVSQALGLADLDNDGDLDVVIGRLNQEVLVYQNESIAPRVGIRLKGRSPNTEGVGAGLRLLGKGLPQQQRIVSGGRYLSADQKLRVFAVPTHQAPHRLEITWPSQRTQVLSNLIANRLYEIEEPSESPSLLPPAPPSSTPPPLMVEVALPTPAIPVDTPWDELALQPLLPVKLSHRGPGLSWVDRKGDGNEELVVTAGRGGRTLLLSRLPTPNGTSLAISAQGGVLESDELMVLKVGDQMLTSSQREPGSRSEVRQGVLASGPAALWTGDQPSGDLVVTTACGPISLGDYDQDGDLDLWVGGPTLIGRFPESAPSSLFRQEANQWNLDARSAAAARAITRVSGLLSSDLDGDGDLDLVSVAEWGGVHVLKNEAGVFSLWDLPVDVSQLAPSLAGVERLSQLTGFWHGVAGGDFDGDGRMDLALSNQGWNHPTGSLLPWHLLFGDFSGNGSVDLIEAFQEPGTDSRLVPWRGLDVLSAALPRLRERYASYRQFSQASVPELLAGVGAAPGTSSLVVRTSTSLVLMNRGDHFEARPLPLEAQMSVATGLVVADFDGDGLEDLFVAQNWFAYPPETPRSAAGRGLMLRGKGRGDFEPLSGMNSGVRIYGEQRGAATADFDHDGRPDLAVAQNQGPVVLLRNQRAKPGLRIRLQGGPGNPECYGASLRLRFTNRYGPRRELHAGSGYYSCDGATTVLATPEPPLAVEVRWPDGTLSEHRLTPSDHELVLKK